MTGQPLTYAYAVLPVMSHDPREPVGLRGGRVRVVRGQRLALAVGDAPAEVVTLDSTSDPELAAEVALTHFDVVEALFRDGPLLPLRMCTVFATDGTALAAVDAQAPALLEALARVDGAAQWTVRVSLQPAKDDSAAEAASGTDYLRRVGERRRDQTDRLVRARQAAARLLGEVGRHAVDVDPGPDDGRTVSASFLVRADAASRFSQAAWDVAEPAEVEVLGPLPPYSFAPRLERAS